MTSTHDGACLGTQQTDNPARNTRLAKLRVPIEQFFGRMEKAWYLTAFINELIKLRNLDEQDYQYHWALYSKRVEIYLEDLKKRRDAYGKSLQNRRRRWSLSSVGDRDEFLYHQQIASNNNNNNI